jgi:hypothetical protein
MDLMELPEMDQEPQPQPQPKPRKPGTFVKGHPGYRKQGAANRISRDIKAGMVDSAIEHGRDGNGKDGLPGFCSWLLKNDLKSWCSIFGRLVPLQVHGDVQVGIQSVNIIAVPADKYLSAEDIQKLTPPELAPVEVEPIDMIARVPIRDCREARRSGPPVRLSTEKNDVRR